MLRASENIHRLLGESHVTLIDEPFGNFVKSQALHDLRNLFSRLSGTTGIARAYPRAADRRSRPGRHRVPAGGGARDFRSRARPQEGFGEAFGRVGGLIASLGDNKGQALLDAGARRMRALTGYDRVTCSAAESSRAESSRGASGGPGGCPADLPMIVADTRR